jgi:hypothetical protein
MRYGLRELDDARDAALAPFHGAIAKARAEQQSRAEAETRKIQERNFRNSLTQTLWWSFYDLSAAEREQASTAVREALDALPEDTPGSDLAAARDRAVRSYLDARRRIH